MAEIVSCKPTYRASALLAGATLHRATIDRVVGRIRYRTFWPSDDVSKTGS